MKKSEVLNIVDNAFHSIGYDGQMFHAYKFIKSVLLIEEEMRFKTSRLFELDLTHLPEDEKEHCKIIMDIKKWCEGSKMMISNISDRPVFIDLMKFIKDIGEFHIRDNEIQLWLDHYDLDNLSDLIKLYGMSNYFLEYPEDISELQWSYTHFVIWFKISDLIIYNFGIEFHDELVRQLKEVEE